jgi:hypothetical protein
MESIDELLNHVASELPEPYGISIGIESNSACVHLTDEAGECLSCIEIGPQANGLEVAVFTALAEAKDLASGTAGATIN